MELSGGHFIYNGVASEQYGLFFANIDTSRLSSLAGESSSVTVYNKSGKKNYYIGENFESSPLIFDAEVVTEDEHSLDRWTRREIEKWLFHQSDYRKLYIDECCDSSGETYEFVNGEYKRLYLNCRFTNPEKVESANGIVGYKFTVECDSRMAWQDPVVCSYTFDSTGESFNTVITVNVDTDDGDYIYPKVVITTGSTGGDIIISNLTDDSTRTTSFDGLTSNITFTMKGEGVNFVSGDNYLKFSNRNFIRLLDGENKISIYGDIIGIEFEFQNRRYL